MPTNAVSIKKVVNIIVPADSKSEDNNSPLPDPNSDADPAASRPSSISAPNSYSPPRRQLQSDDVLFPEPTFSERFMRYLTIGIYLGGLSSLGFFLSIYYIFFWDSRMPPVYKPAKKATTVFMKP